MNKFLSDKCVGAQSVHVTAALLDWWQTPHPCLPRHTDGSYRSPLDLLNSVTEACFTKIIEETDAMTSFAVQLMADSSAYAPTMSEPVSPIIH